MHFVNTYSPEVQLVIIIEYHKNEAQALLCRMVYFIKVLTYYWPRFEFSRCAPLGLHGVCTEMQRFTYKATWVIYTGFQAIPIPDILSQPPDICMSLYPNMRNQHPRAFGMLRPVNTSLLLFYCFQFVTNKKITLWDY